MQDDPRSESPSTDGGGPAVRGVGAVPLPYLTGQPPSGPAATNDTVLVAALLTLGVGFVGWLLSTVQAPVLGVFANNGTIPAASFAVLLGALGFVEGIGFTVVLGILLGRVTPQNFLPGLLIGKGIGFLLSLVWSLVVMPAFVSAGVRNTVRTGMLVALPVSLLWLAVYTVATLLIARSVARRRM